MSFKIIDNKIVKYKIISYASHHRCVIISVCIVLGVVRAQFAEKIRRFTVKRREPVLSARTSIKPRKQSLSTTNYYNFYAFF